MADTEAAPDSRNETKSTGSGKRQQPLPTSPKNARLSPLTYPTDGFRRSHDSRESMFMSQCVQSAGLRVRMALQQPQEK